MIRANLHTWRMTLKRTLVRVRRTVPPGLRLVVGLIVTVLGLFGFLPILGFWMIPLGIAIASLDVRPLMQSRRKPRGRR